MIRTLTHQLLVTFSVMLLLTVSVYALGNWLGEADAIREFFTESEGCTETACFLGIVADQTEQRAIYALLDDAPYIADFRMTQVEFGLGQLFIEWDGTQPDFMTQDGYLTLVGERAETIELNVDLLLGDMLVALGEPTQIIVSTFNTYLYYTDEGIVLESSINCDAIYHSPVRVIYRQQVLQLSTISSNHVTIHDACR